MIRRIKVAIQDFFIFCFLGAVTFGIIYLLNYVNFFYIPKAVYVSPLPAFGGIPFSPPIAINSGREQTLADAVSRALEGSQGDYGIIVKNLKTGEVYRQDPDRIYDAGSIYKMWLMASVYKKIALGEMTFGQTMSASVADLNSWFGLSSDVAELTDGGFTFTVKEALEQMVTISHNYAAMMLSRQVGAKTVVGDLSSFGLANTEFKLISTTTPQDNVDFLERLYLGRIVDKKTSTDMLALLSRQKLNDGLPKYLPVRAKVAHKTGEIGEYKHDVGIVFAPFGDYIIAIFSKSASPFGAEERIAQISKQVFDYFEGQKKPKS